MNGLAVALLSLVPVLAWAQTGDLVTRLTSDRVDISARYTGDEITLFGAMSAPGQIVVKVRSPDQTVALERKGQVGPFWLSQGKHIIEGMPGLFYLLASAPIDDLLPAEVRLAQGLDLGDALKAVRVSPEPADEAERQMLKDAALRRKEARGYYASDPKAVEILSGRLYSTTIRLPAKLPLGQYDVDIYLVRDRRLADTEHLQIGVNEVHLELWVSDMATNRPWLFGAVFTLAMMVLGLLLGVVLQHGGKA